MLLMAIQTVQGERDTFCEISKEAEVNLKLFEEEIRCKSEEIEDAKKNLNFANSKLLNAGDKIAELQSLLLQREIEQQTLEQTLEALEGEALASDAVDEREMFSEKIKKLMEALRETTEEKAVLVQKGEVMHTTIQVHVQVILNNFLVQTLLFSALLRQCFSNSSETPVMVILPTSLEQCYLRTMWVSPLLLSFHAIDIAGISSLRGCF